MEFALNVGLNRDDNGTLTMLSKSQTEAIRSQWTTRKRFVLSTTKPRRQERGRRDEYASRLKDARYA